MNSYFKNTITALQTVNQYFIGLQKKGALTPKEERVWRAVSKAIDTKEPEERKKPVSDCWKETHFDISCAIHEHRMRNDEDPESVVTQTIEENGTAALYELANELTSKFEELYENVVWGEELEYYDTLETFLQSELYSKKP